VNFCSKCGSARVEQKTPLGEDRARDVCKECNEIFYQNPKIVAGCIPIWEGKVLLCKRAIEPRYGWWTLPAGYMENGETIAEAAKRETAEEACADVVIEKLFALFSLPEINQVYMIFLSQLTSPDFSPGLESLECELFSETEIPWSEIAFPTITHSLSSYFEDKRNGIFKQHIGDIRRKNGELIFQPQLTEDKREVPSHW
jgi:ADP-ribose pyrophosphatase YjhB (NUDIX family)